MGNGLHIIYEISYGTRCNDFYTSYLPEHNIQPQKRSEVSLSQSLNEIIFTVKALDITAFRATINSILQFGNIVYKIGQRVDSQK